VVKNNPRIAGIVVSNGFAGLNGLNGFNGFDGFDGFNCLVVWWFFGLNSFVWGEINEWLSTSQKHVGINAYLKHRIIASVRWD
jgi:hypothetical protein